MCESSSASKKQMTECIFKNVNNSSKLVICQQQFKINFFSDLSRFHLNHTEDTHKTHTTLCYMYLRAFFIYVSHQIDLVCSVVKFSSLLTSRQKITFFVYFINSHSYARAKFPDVFGSFDLFFTKVK